MCRRICAPPELSIKIFNLITSYLTSPYTSCIVDSIQCDTIDKNRRSARTTLLLCRRICAPPELSIKIFNLITSYVALHHNLSVS